MFRQGIINLYIINYCNFVFQLDVLNRTSNIDLENYVPNGEWELLGRFLHIYHSAPPHMKQHFLKIFPCSLSNAFSVCQNWNEIIFSDRLCKHAHTIISRNYILSFRVSERIVQFHWHFKPVWSFPLKSKAHATETRSSVEPVSSYVLEHFKLDPICGFNALHRSVQCIYMYIYIWRDSPPRF